MNEDNRDNEKGSRSKILQAAVCAAGLFAGGLLGLAGGLVIGGELAVVLCYILGAVCGGVASPVAIQIWRGRDITNG